MSIVVLLLVVAGLYASLFFSPPLHGPDGEYLGESFRIFFLHVPAAWTSFFCFFMAFLLAIAHLYTRRRRLDVMSAAWAETGLIFATIVITTGPIWGRAAWGAYWTWEPRLTSFLVLWTMYLGYVLLRSAVEDAEKRGVFSSVMAILSFLNVPIVFYAIKLWGAKSHPVPGPNYFGNPDIRATIFINLGALLATAALFAHLRSRVENEHD